MTNKHTPGPWWYAAADAERYEAGCGDIPLSVPTTRANARLIAASPDLLVALIDAADALVIHAPDSWVLTQARAAIARAKGE